jgi:hypothetical protein
VWERHLDHLGEYLAAHPEALDAELERTARLA